jgi:hypothetical protein
MSRQYWVAPVGPLQIADGTKNTFTTLVDVSGAPQITLGANQLELGSELEIQASGEFSTTGTPTFTFGFYYGGIAGVALAASSAITTGSGAAAWPWVMRYRGIVRAIGSAGSIKGQGILYMGSSLTAVNVRPIPEVAASRTVAIDTTAAKAVTFGSACGTSSASNIITCYDISVKLVT